jgi:hypothetical protein
MTAGNPAVRHDKPKCGAKKKQGAGNCRRPAGWGTDHPGTGQCKLHGGCMPNNRASAIGQQAAKLLYRHDATPVTDPLEALQRLAGRALALEETIGKLVNDLTSIRYESGGESSSEQLRAEVAVLERAMDRCGKLLVDIAKLNIEERMARVTEAQAAMVQEAFRKTLGEMGMAPEQQRDAQARLGRHLRAVS